MDRKELAKAARRAYAEDVRHQGGVNGRPFWNISAVQFMYAPAFNFCPYFGSVPVTKFPGFLFEAKDRAGKTLTFTAESPRVPLTPIWDALTPGPVTLTVYALNRAGEKAAVAGARTFLKSAPFPEELPPKAASYKECAKRVLDHMFRKPYMQNWITEGKPYEDYDLYVYPSKMIASIIRGMLAYETLAPEHAEAALTVAKNAADWIIGETYTEGPAAGLPPTYSIDWRSHPETRDNAMAKGVRLTSVMMLYPACMGSAYLQLYERTGEGKYLEAARTIGEYYRTHVKPSGLWDLSVSILDGSPLYDNEVDPTQNIVPFLTRLAEVTGDDAYRKLADRAMERIEAEYLPRFNWEGQFEDAPVSVEYSNLTHFMPDSLARYYCARFPQDEKKLETAEILANFAEDQFVNWSVSEGDFELTQWDRGVWPMPCAMEQYAWYTPIDSSAATIMRLFLDLYKADRGELYLAKARAIADSITRVQAEDGSIATHWDANCGGQDWINCMIHTALYMLEIAPYEE